MKTANEILAPILGKIHLSVFDPKELVSAAIELISNNIENESILILAGLDQNPKSEDGELKFYYFDLGLKELGIDYLDTKPIGYFERAHYIINAVLKDYIKPRSGLNLLAGLCRESQYDEQLLPFFTLDDEIDLYIHENQTLFRKHSEFKNLDDLIRSELKKFQHKFEKNHT